MRGTIVFSFLSPRPEVGDVVRLTAPASPGLLAEPLPSGSIGVVVAAHGSRLEVEVDAGAFGPSTVTAPVQGCRVIERAAGVEPFRRRMQRRNAVRIGALVLLVLPFVQYAWAWWAATGSLDGLVESIPSALIESLGDFLRLAFGDPLRAVLSSILGWVVWFLAFGRRRR